MHAGTRMASYGGLEQIFGMSMPNNPTLDESWKHIVSMKPRDHYSFTEIFDLYLKDNHLDQDHHHPQYSSASSSLFTLSPSSSLSSDDDVDDAIKNAKCIDHCEQYNNLYCEKKRSPIRKHGGGGFPPPISCIGKTGKPVWLQSTRQDGRLMLTEVRIPNQDFLHAFRENGRLKLHYVHSDEEEDEDEDEEEGEDKKEKEA